MSRLVTGAPGWLGTDVVRRLHKRGTHAWYLTLESVDTSRLEPHNMTTHPGVRNLDSLHEAFEGGVDAVFHRAGIIHPPRLPARTSSTR